MFSHDINVGQANSRPLEFLCGAVLTEAGAGRDGSTDAPYQTLDLVLITLNHIDHPL